MLGPCCLFVCVDFKYQGGMTGSQCRDPEAAEPCMSVETNQRQMLFPPPPRPPLFGMLCPSHLSTKLQVSLRSHHEASSRCSWSQLLWATPQLRLTAKGADRCSGCQGGHLLQREGSIQKPSFPGQQAILQNWAAERQELKEWNIQEGSGVLLRGCAPGLRGDIPFSRARLWADSLPRQRDSFGLKTQDSKKPGGFSEVAQQHLQSHSH